MIERDLRCPQGDSFHFTFTIRESLNGEPGEPKDMSGYSAASQIKDSLSNGDLMASMIFNSSEEDLENGIISLYLEPETTQDISIGTYYYDIIVYNETNVLTYFKGKFFIISKITENVSN